MTRIFSCVKSRGAWVVCAVVCAEMVLAAGMCCAQDAVTQATPAWDESEKGIINDPPALCEEGLPLDECDGKIVTITGMYNIEPRQFELILPTYDMVLEAEKWRHVSVVTSDNLFIVIVTKADKPECPGDIEATGKLFIFEDEGCPEGVKCEAQSYRLVTDGLRCSE